MAFQIAVLQARRSQQYFQKQRVASEGRMKLI
jgi:hypothetical protein